jgi:hypothetical protein
MLLVKKFFLFLVIFCIMGCPSILAAEAQQSTPSTQLEAFSSKTGEIIIDDYYPLGTIIAEYGAHIKISAEVIYSPGKEQQRVKGMRFELSDGGKYEKTAICFLDMDELSGFSKACAYMIDLMNKWKDTSRQYTEVTFYSKGKLKFGFYQEGTEQQAFMEGGTINRPTCFLRSDKLTLINQYTSKAIELLSQK